MGCCSQLGFNINTEHMYREPLCINIEARLCLHSIPNKKGIYLAHLPLHQNHLPRANQDPRKIFLNLPPKPVVVKLKYPSFPFKCYEFLTHSP